MASSLPAQLEADLPTIRCATARRGGKPCRDAQCVCLDCETLLERADATLARILRSSADLSPRDRAAAEDWRRTFAQDNRERAAAAALPRDLWNVVNAIIEPPGLSVAALADVERLRMAVRGDETTPAPRALVVRALRWIRQNLCQPRAGEPR